MAASPRDLLLILAVGTARLVQTHRRSMVTMDASERISLGEIAKQERGTMRTVSRTC